MSRSLLPGIGLATVLVGLTFVSVAPQPALGALLVIDEEDGLIAEGVLDGGPFNNSDGIPDSFENAPIVALKTTSGGAGPSAEYSLEARTILEIPLASLSGLTSADVDSASLRFNIDDIVGTFGPGTAFDGRATSSIVLFGAAGDGVVDPNDYTNVGGFPTAVVPTGTDPNDPNTFITDASLAVSGPLVYDADVTTLLKSLLDGAATHMAITMAIQDDLTATSLDNLGDGGSGPEGVNGSAMPVLRIVTAETDPTIYGKDELKCVKKLAKTAAKHGTTLQKNMAQCIDKILTDISKAKDTTKSAEKCVKALDPAADKSKIGKSRTKAEAGIAKSCDGLAPAAIGTPCDDSAASMDDTVACVLDAAEDAAQDEIRASYADACKVLTFVGVDSLYETACTQ